MKVALKKDTNIIDIPEEGAVRLLEITPSGFFKYQVTYRTDPRKVVQNKSILVKIMASPKPFAKQSSKLLTQFNPDQLIKNIQKKSSINRDQGKSQTNKIFFTYLSDISSKIPNDKTTLLSLKPKIQGTVADVVIKKDKILKVKSVQDITSENVILPVLENNISTALLQSDLARNTGIARAVSLDLLTTRGIDPAKISGAKTRTIQSAQKVAGGMISQPTRELDRFYLTETQKVSYFGNLINQTNPTNHLQLRPTDFINVMVDSPRTTIDIVEDIEIPTGLLQIDQFFFVLQLVDKNGVEVQTINISVPHTKNISDLEIPVVPPKMLVLQTGSPGKNIINVKQMDPNATGVALYRKEIKKNIPVTDSAYTFIGNLEATANQDFQRLEDVVNNFNTIIYRAIPYNSSKVLSGEFESAGALAVKRRTAGKYRNRHNFISILGEVVNGAIAMEIRDVPPGVCLVKLMKRNLSIRESSFSLALKPFFITNEETSAPIFATDNDVKEDRIYEYQVELLYPDGTVETGANNLIIKYEPVTANIVVTTPGKPNIEQSGGDLDVTFDISSSLIPGDLDLIKKTLEDQGLLPFYQDGLSQEKEKLQSIVAYGVKRANITTGEMEDFGILSDNKFSDKKFGSIKNVRPLQAGNEYRYYITTYFRKAETTLEEVTRTVQSSANLTYTFKPAKWLHPLTLKKGSLTTENSRKTNHAETVFSFGAVGNVTTVNISLANILPSITEAKAQKFGKNSTLIQWRVQGQVTKIDHFIIILEMVGMRTIVGKCHNISESNYFQFVDALDNGENGKMTYYIVPVFYDFSRGTEVPTNEVLI